MLYHRHHASVEVNSVELRCAHCGEAMAADTVDVLPGSGFTGDLPT